MRKMLLKVLYWIFYPLAIVLLIIALALGGEESEGSE